MKKLPEVLFLSGMKTSHILTGTSTGIGKTLASAILMLGTGARYWKPVQSGMAEGSDTEFVKQVTGLPDDRFFPEGIRLTQPLSPHLAADFDGVSLDPDVLLQVPDSPDPLIIEGAGGLMVPLSWSWLQIDYFAELGCPVILVTSTQLGTINHTLLSLEALRSRHIPVAGLVLNGEWNEGNDRSLRHFGQVPILGWIPPLTEPFTPELLKSVFRQQFDQNWFGAE